MTIKTENLMDGYTSQNLTLVELMYLLTMICAKIGDSSPLGQLSAGVRPSGGPDVAIALRSKGILSADEPPRLNADLAAALVSLGNPRWSIQLRMGNFREVTAAAFYGGDGLSDKSLVGLKGTPENGFGVSYFLSKEHVLALLEPYVQLSTLTVTAPFEFRLSHEEYLVFLAIVDAYRHAHLQALLDRKTLTQWTVSEADIDSALYKGFTYPDTRWLVSIGQIISPFAFGWDSKSARIGIDGLVKRGVIVPIPEKFAPAYFLSRELEIFCGMAIGLLGFATIQIDEVLANGRKGIFYVNILRTPASIWVSGFNNLSSGTPEVTIFSVDGFFLSHAIAELFERSGKPEPLKTDREMREAAGTAKRVMIACPSCKAQIEQRMRFCGYCGKPMPTEEGKKQPPETRFCTKCGAAVKAGMQFCANCGTAMKERKTTRPPSQSGPAASTCRACGAELVAGKKFCTKCGAAVA